MCPYYLYSCFYLNAWNYTKSWLLETVCVATTLFEDIQQKYYYVGQQMCIKACALKPSIFVMLPPSIGMDSVYIV